MNELSTKKFYRKKGYTIIQNFLTQKELTTLRKEILSLYSSTKSKRILFNREVIEKIPSLLDLRLNKKLVSTLKAVIAKDFQYVNDLSIQKNICRLSPHTGWHVDVQSQEKIRYINKELTFPNYNFCKIGIYLQDSNCPYGGSIEVVPGSHKWAYFTRRLVIYLLFHPIISKLIRSVLVK